MLLAVLEQLHGAAPVRKELGWTHSWACLGLGACSSQPQFPVCMFVECYWGGRAWEAAATVLSCG